MKLVLSIDLKPIKEEHKAKVAATINAILQKTNTAIKDQELLYNLKVQMAQNYLDSGDTQNIDLLQGEATLRNMSVRALAESIISKSNNVAIFRQRLELLRVEANLEIDSCKSVNMIEGVTNKWLLIISEQQ